MTAGPSYICAGDTTMAITNSYRSFHGTTAFHGTFGRDGGDRSAERCHAWRAFITCSLPEDRSVVRSTPPVHINHRDPDAPEEPIPPDHPSFDKRQTRAR